MRIIAFSIVILCCSPCVCQTKTDAPDFNSHFREQIKAAQQITYPVFSFSEDMKLGDFGAQSGATTIKLFEKLDDQTGLVMIERRRTESVAPSGTFSGFAAGRGFSGSGGRLITELHGPFLLEGHDISKNAEESEITIGGDNGFHVIGTFEYNSLTGPRTVFRVAKIILPPLPTGPSSVNSEYRTWSDQSGKFSVTAKFGGLSKGTLRLVKDSGEVVTVPLTRVCESDRTYVLQMQEQDREYVKKLKLKK